MNGRFSFKSSAILPIEERRYIAIAEIGLWYFISLEDVESFQYLNQAAAISAVTIKVDSFSIIYVVWCLFGHDGSI